MFQGAINEKPAVEPSYAVSFQEIHVQDDGVLKTTRASRIFYDIALYTLYSILAITTITLLFLSALMIR